MVVLIPLLVVLLDSEPITVDDDEWVESNDVGSDDGLDSRRGMLICEAAPRNVYGIVIASEKHDFFKELNSDK